MTLEYVYCVVQLPVEGALPAPAGPPPGLDGGAVRLVSLADDERVRAPAPGELALVVSAVAAAEYGTLEARIGDAAWLTPRAVAHDAVVTWAADAAAGAVVPLPMWVLFAGADAARRGLAAEGATLAAALAGVRGAREYAVRIVADAATVEREATRLDPDVAAVAARARTASPGQAYLLRRQLAERQRAAVREIAARVSEETHAALAAAARDVAPAGERTGGSLPGTVLDAAYLVAHERYDSFRAALTDAVARYGDAGFRFDFTGPWPPYHFAGGR